MTFPSPESRGEKSGKPKKIDVILFYEKNSFTVGAHGQNFAKHILN